MSYGNNQSDSPGAAVRDSLNSLAPKLLPTPDVSSGHRSPEGLVRSATNGGQVSLQNVAEILSTGGRIAPLSNGGNTSSGDQRQPPPNPGREADNDWHLFS